MNYHKIYENLICKAKNRIVLKEDYIEKHHIIPRCMNGTNNKENIVKLTPEEHLLAHKLLCKIYPTVNGLYVAITLMSKFSNMRKYGSWKRGLSNFFKEKWKDPNYQEKMKKSMKKAMTSEVKMKIGSASKVRWNLMTIDSRKERIKKWTKLGSIAAAKKNKELWENPEYRDAILLQRKKLIDSNNWKTNSEKLKARWKTPEFREKMKNRKRKGENKES